MLTNFSKTPWHRISQKCVWWG